MSKVEIISKRIADLRNAMTTNQIDCYLVFTSDYHQSEYIDGYFKTREYLSGFTGSAGWMAITHQEVILWVDGRYYVQAAAEIAGTEIQMYKYGLAGTPTILEYVKSHIDEGQVVACDGQTISATFLKELKKATSAQVRTDLDLFNDIWPNRPKMANHKIYELPVSISGQSRRDKIKHVRSLLQDKDSSAYLLDELSAIMWLYNIRGNDVSCNPVAFSYSYISKDSAVLFLQDGVCPDDVMASLQSDGILVLPYQEISDYLKGLKDQTICLDKSSLNSYLYEVVSLNNSVKNVKDDEFVPKYIKNETELNLAREYHKLDAVAMIRFIMYIKEAVKTQEITEYEAAMYVNKLRSENEGFYDISFDTICAYGSNGAIVHYDPDEKDCAVLKPEGFLLLDSGAQYYGATTDITRTIVLGDVTDQMKRDFTAVLKAVIRLADVKFMKGTTGIHLDILARGPIWDLGIDYRHGTGHGIGAFLNVHEGPQNIRFKTTDPKPAELEAGMITSDEPGIYIEGEYGIRTENEIVCCPYIRNEWGEFLQFETITLVPIDLDAVNPELMNSDEIKWLNSYHKRIYDTISPYLKENEKEWLKKATREI